MGFGKKYYVGVKLTPVQLTEKLSQEELLPKNYALQTCKNLESLHTQISTLENQDIYCGVIISKEIIIYPLEYEGRSIIDNLNADDYFVVIYDK
jgi:hypothetical protein